MKKLCIFLLSVIVVFGQYYSFGQNNSDIIFSKNYFERPEYNHGEIKLSMDNKYFLSRSYQRFNVGLLINSDLVYSNNAETTSKMITCDFLADSKHIVVVNSYEITIINLISQDIVEIIPFDLKDKSFGCVFIPESNKMCEVYFSQETNLIYSRYFDIKTKTFSKETIVGKAGRKIKGGTIYFSDDKRQNIFISVDEGEVGDDWEEREKKAKQDKYYNSKFDRKKNIDFRFFFEDRYFEEFFIFNSKVGKLAKIKHTEILLYDYYGSPTSYFNFSPDGKYLTYSNIHQNTLLYECATGEIVKEFKNIICSAMTNDNRYLIGYKIINNIIGYELKLFSFETGLPISKLNTTSKYHGLVKTFFYNDLLIVTGSSNEFFDIKTQKKLFEKTFGLYKDESGNYDLNSRLQCISPFLPLCLLQLLS